MNNPNDNPRAAIEVPAEPVFALIAADLATMARDLDAAVNKTPSDSPILADAVAEALHWIRNKRKGEATAQRTIAHLQGRIDNLVAKVERLEGDAAPAAPAEPVAWGMRDKTTGLILDVICPDEHDSHAGDYTIPLYVAPCWTPEQVAKTQEIAAELKAKVKVKPEAAPAAPAPLTGEPRLGWQCESEIASEPLYRKAKP